MISLAYEFRPMTREQIENLEDGDTVRFRINGLICSPHRVAEVQKGYTARNEAWALFYEVHQDGSRTSGSVVEGTTANNYHLFAKA